MSSSRTSQESPSPNKRQRTDEEEPIDMSDPINRAAALLRPSRPANPEDIDEVYKALQDLVFYAQKWKKLEGTIQARNMNMYDVEKAFGLKAETENVMWKHRPVEVPSWVLESMEHTTEVTLDWSRTSEAYARLMINQVLVAAIYVQSRRQELAEVRSTNTTPPAALGLVLEVALEQRVRLRGKNLVVKGIADYAIFYDHNEDDKSATCLIALEAKKRFSTSAAIPQLAAYVGIIHTQRKRAGKRNCVVWGFASDGVEYRFCRVDNQGFLTFARGLEFVGPEQEIIFGILCGIVKAAALTSPHTSPEKNPEVRAKILAAMGTRDPQRMLKFDYGISEENYGLDSEPSLASAHTNPRSQTKDEAERATGESKAEGDIE